MAGDGLHTLWFMGEGEGHSSPFVVHPVVVIALSLSHVVVLPLSKIDWEAYGTMETYLVS